jgi:signal transduction histidine kinase/ActR/RegA family two-component response regulator
MSLARRYALTMGATAAGGALAAMAAGLFVVSSRVGDLSTDMRAGLANAVERQLHGAGEALATALAQRARPSLLDLDAEALARLAGGSLGAAATDIRFYDSQGRALADASGALPDDAQPAPSRLTAARASDGAINWREGEDFATGVPICIRDQCIGAVVVVIDGAPALAENAIADAELARARMSAVAEAAAYGLAALCLAGAAAGGAGLMMGRRMRRAVDAVLSGIDRIGAGDAHLGVEPRDRQLAQLARAIQELADRLRAEGTLNDAAIEALNDGMMVADAEGQIVLANAALHDLLKVARTTLVGADAHTTFGLEQTAASKALASALAELAQVPTGDGGVLPVLVSARVAGEPPTEQVVALLRDASPLIALEAEAASARLRAETAERARAEFLAVMSHELRTPLNGVLGGAAVLAGTELDGGQRRLVQMVQQSGRAMLKLISNLLDFSRLHGEGARPDIGPVNLAALAAAIVDSVADAAAAKGLPVSMHVQSDAPVISSDFEKLLQLGANLADNAVKFTDAGEVDIDIRHHVSGDEAEVLMVVRDTGCGIAPDAQDRIFEGFAQSDSSERREKGGAGIGLALAAKLAEALGAEITVDSAPGAGSTFTVRLRAPLDPDWPRPTSAEPARGTARDDAFADRIKEKAGAAAPANAAAASAAHHVALKDFSSSPAAEPTSQPIAVAPIAIAMAPIMGGEAEAPAPTAGATAEPAPLAAIPMAMAPLMGGAPAEAAPPPPRVDELSAPSPDSPNDMPTIVAPDAEATDRPEDPVDFVEAETHAFEPTNADDDADAVDRPETHAGDEADEDDAEPPAGPLILLADDNQVNRIVLTTFLRKAGYACEAASTAAETLEKARLKPRLVLVASSLSDSTGAALAETLRARDKAATNTATPIIGIAPLGDDRAAAAMIDAGADGVITRPVKLDQLTHQLRKLIGVPPRAR